MNGHRPRSGVAGVVLAAGGGSRLGGRAKALLRHGGEFLVERAVEAARDAGCAPVAVVLGASAAEVRRQARLDDVLVVDNGDWREGIGSSLRAGLASLPGDLDAAVVLLVDQPFVSSAALRAVLAAHRRGARLASASYGGRRGHPVLLGAEHWDAVMSSARGDLGARDFLATHQERMTVVPCDGLGDPCDIDTPGDLSLLRNED